MKAHPSIAFDSFSGSAGEVTARYSKNGTILSSRAQHDKVSTPAQKAERAILARSVLGQNAQLTGINLYQRLNFWIVKCGGSALATPSAPTQYTRVQAIFETDLEASVNVEIEGEGQVTGDGDYHIGDYHIGDTAVLRAVPDAGYRFAGWSDGETAAERSIVVEDSVWLTATFEEE